MLCNFCLYLFKKWPPKDNGFQFELLSFASKHALPACQALKSAYDDQFVIEDKPKHFGIFCTIRGVKVDLVRYPHPTIRPGYEVDGIRFISTEEIVATKVQAVLGRAHKKDFRDIATLLEHYPVEDFARFHKEKYSAQNLLITVPQAITYFAEAEDDADPKSLKGQTWESVQAAIRKHVRGFLC